MSVTIGHYQNDRANQAQDDCGIQQRIKMSLGDYTYIIGSKAMQEIDDR